MSFFAFLVNFSYRLVKQFYYDPVTCATP